MRFLKSQEERIAELEQKVAKLERIVYKNKKAVQTPMQISTSVEQLSSQSRPSKQDVPKQKQKSNKIGEVAVGKYLIGSLASILILIAAVSLVALVWGTLTDVVRLGLIAGAGAILTTLGFFLIKKNKNPITSIILGTGSGLLKEIVETLNHEQSWQVARFINTNLTEKDILHHIVEYRLMRVLLTRKECFKCH